MAALDSETLAEMKVLSALLSCVAGGPPVPDVRSLVRPVLEAQSPKDAESLVRSFAMMKLLGEPLSPPELEAGEGAASRLFVRTARAWMLWAVGRLDEAKIALKTTVCEPSPREGGGEIHLMAIGPWCVGVSALLRDDPEEARRFFRRSVEVGSQLGTETNNAIQWALVATFFDHKP